MSIEAHAIEHHDLVAGLRAEAVGRLALEAAVELLIRHDRWLREPALVDRLVRVDDPLGEDLRVDWDTAADLIAEALLQPEDRSVLAIAASIAVGEPVALSQRIPAMRRDTVALVLAAIAHAAGTHLQVDHVGELNTAGEWVATSTSPRVSLGPVVSWPDAPGR